MNSRVDFIEDQEIVFSGTEYFSDLFEALLCAGNIRGGRSGADEIFTAIFSEGDVRRQPRDAFVLARGFSLEELGDINPFARPSRPQSQTQGCGGFPFSRSGIDLDKTFNGLTPIGITKLQYIKLHDHPHINKIKKNTLNIKNLPQEIIMREIRRRTQVVGCFPDGKSALMLVAARLRYIAGNKWGKHRYMNMERFEEKEQQSGESRHGVTLPSPVLYPSTPVQKVEEERKKAG